MAKKPIVVFAVTFLLFQTIAYAMGKYGNDWTVMKPWDVPWSWECAFIIFGVAKSSNLFVVDVLHRLGLDLDVGKFALLEEITVALVESFIMSVMFSFYKPLPEDLFHWDVMDPFMLSWAIPGSVCAAACSAMTVMLSLGFDYFSGIEISIWENLNPLLPPVNSSRVSLICMVIAKGLLAPHGEQIMFQGLLTTTLSHLYSVPSAVTISSLLFSASHLSLQQFHLSLQQFPHLFVIGIVFGLLYSQTRNLVTPFIIQSIWSLGLLAAAVYKQEVP